MLLIVDNPAAAEPFCHDPPDDHRPVIDQKRDPQIAIERRGEQVRLLKEPKYRVARAGLRVRNFGANDVAIGRLNVRINQQ